MLADSNKKDEQGHQKDQTSYLNCASAPVLCAESSHNPGKAAHIRRSQRFSSITPREINGCYRQSMPEFTVPHNKCNGFSHNSICRYFMYGNLTLKMLQPYDI
jgi:hypothetical protein